VRAIHLRALAAAALLTGAALAATESGMTVARRASNPVPGPGRLPLVEAGMEIDPIDAPSPGNETCSLRPGSLGG
jgi:hypothetical protein